MGRYAGGMKSLDLSIYNVNMGSALRTLFVLTFLAIALDWSPSFIFGSDWFKITNLVLFAYTNGYVSTLCGVKAPGTAKDDNHRASIGGCVGLCIQIGVLTGTFVAAGFAPLIKANPLP